MNRKSNLLLRAVLLPAFLLLLCSACGKPMEEPETILPETLSPETEFAETDEQTEDDPEAPGYVLDTDLYVAAVREYDGVYFEDGSDRDVTGTAALFLENRGETALEYARIFLVGTKKTLTFEVSGVEAGAKVVALEADAVSFVEQAYTEVYAEDLALTDDFSLSEDLVHVEDTGKGSLRVTNRTDKTIPAVRIFYKFYQAEQKMYAGGITYVVRTEAIGSGETVEIEPPHYASGGSRIVMVRTYEE